MRYTTFACILARRVPANVAKTGCSYLATVITVGCFFNATTSPSPLTILRMAKARGLAAAHVSARLALGPTSSYQDRLLSQRRTAEISQNEQKKSLFPDHSGSSNLLFSAGISLKLTNILIKPAGQTGF